jgi:RNA polymerase sigma factor (sigma-70 family)
VTRDEEVAVARELDSDDPDVRHAAVNRLCEANLRVCEFEAQHLLHRGVEREDLEQCGFFGLLRTCNHFDVSRGFRFSTLAKWYVRGAMLAEIDKHSEPIRVPDFHRRLRRHVDAILEESGGNVTIETLAARTGATESQVTACLQHARVVASIDAHETLVATIAADEEDLDAAIDLATSVAALPPDQQQVVRLHHLKERPLPEVIRTVHHRHSTVRDTEAQALAALAAAMAS